MHLYAKASHPAAAGLQHQRSSGLCRSQAEGLGSASCNRRGVGVRAPALREDFGVREGQEGLEFLEEIKI